MKVFIEPGIPTDGLQDGIREQRMVVTRNRESADIFVVTNPTHPGQRTHLISMLAGKYIVSSEFLENGGQGACLAFKPVIRIKRLVWITPKFEECHNTLCDIFRKLVGSESSKWVFLESLDRFKRETENRQQGHRRTWRTMEVICLCTKKEKRVDGDPGPFNQT
eukprot:6375221-Pyramimonas_sp.AAC.1